MKAEIIMIGTELLIGQIQDTNATYLGQTLAENGIDLYQKTTVGDNLERIKGVLDAALMRSDVVLCSGGLGPTADDITREALAEVLGRPLEFHENLFIELKEKFAKVSRVMPDNNKKQCYLPKGAETIPNPIGSAPGVLLEDERGTVICMPGVPRELKMMMADQVLPLLLKKFGVQGVLHYRVLKVCGYGESRVDEAIEDLVNNNTNPTVGVLASPEFVRIRIAAKASNLDEADKIIEPVANEIYKRLPNMIMGENESTLENTVDELLRKRAWQMGIWESGSGGILSQRLLSGMYNSFFRSELSSVVTSSINESVDKARVFLLESGLEMALIVRSDMETGNTEVMLISPLGEELWQFGHYGQDHIRQLRTAVLILEKLRRFLLETS